MSLMFAALRTLEGERAAPLAAPAARRRPALAPWPAVAWLGAGAVLGAGLFWLAWPRVQAPAAQVAPPIQRMAPVAARLAWPAAAPAIADGHADAVDRVAAATPAPPAATPPAPQAAATPAPVADAPAPAPTSRGFAPLPPGSLVVRDADKAGAHAPAREADDPDPAAVARHVDAMGTAIEGSDFVAAQGELQALQHLLPARSLTLLRMRAWLAQRQGDTAQALPLYREIVARMPGDRGAAINLALLEAGNGQLDEARQRLRDLRAGESEASDNERQALARAVAEVGVAP